MKLKMGKREQSAAITFMLFLAICSAVASLTVLIFAPSKYTILCLLPLSFGLLSCIFGKNYTLLGNSITVTLLLGLLFLRNVITPVMMSLGTNASASSVDTTEKIPYAVLLLVYEQLAIFLAVYYFAPKIKAHLSNKNIREYDISKTHLNWFIIILSLIALFVAVLLIVYPQLSATYSFGMVGNEEDTIALIRRRIRMDEEVPGIPRNLFRLLAEILRWGSPIIVTLKLYMSKLQNWLKILLSLAVTVGVALLVSETVATSLFIVVSVFFLMYKLYRGHGSGVIVVAFVAAAIAAAAALLIKSVVDGSELNLGGIAQILQAYLSGPDNVAIAAMIEEPVTAEQILGDTFGFIPLVMYFFQELPNTRELFNFTFFGNSELQTQIIPMISQGARYFTPFLAPIFSIIVVRLALVWEMRAYKRQELLYCAIMIVACVCFSMGAAMYSASLVLQQFFTYILPLMLMYYFISAVIYKKSTKALSAE